MSNLLVEGCLCTDAQGSMLSPKRIGQVMCMNAQGPGPCAYVHKVICLCMGSQAGRTYVWCLVHGFTRCVFNLGSSHLRTTRARSGPGLSGLKLTHPIPDPTIYRPCNPLTRGFTVSAMTHNKRYVKLDDYPGRRCQPGSPLGHVNACHQNHLASLPQPSENPPVGWKE